LASRRIGLSSFCSIAPRCTLLAILSWPRSWLVSRSLQLAASRSCRGSSFAYRRMKASLPPLLDGLSAGQNQPFPFLEYENWAAVKDQSQVSICQCHRKLTINLLPHVERLLTSPKEDRPSRGVSSTYVWTRLLKDVVTCRKHQPSEGSLTIK